MTEYNEIIQWGDIRSLREAYRLFAVFRAANPLIGAVQPEVIHWEVTWAERFTPLDMDDSPEVRAERRCAAVVSVTLSCAIRPDSKGNSLPVRDRVPAVIRRSILSAEQER